MAPFPEVPPIYRCIPGANGTKQCGDVIQGSRIAGYAIVASIPLHELICRNAGPPTHFEAMPLRNHENASRSPLRGWLLLRRTSCDKRYDTLRSDWEPIRWRLARELRSSRQRRDRKQYFYVPAIREEPMRYQQTSISRSDERRGCAYTEQAI